MTQPNKHHNRFTQTETEPKSVDGVATPARRDPNQLRLSSLLDAVASPAKRNLAQRSLAPFCQAFGPGQGPMLGSAGTPACKGTGELQYLLAFLTRIVFTPASDSNRKATSGRKCGRNRLSARQTLR